MARPRSANKTTANVISRTNEIRIKGSVLKPTDFSFVKENPEFDYTIRMIFYLRNRMNDIKRYVDDIEKKSEELSKQLPVDDDKKPYSALLKKMYQEAQELESRKIQVDNLLVALTEVKGGVSYSQKYVDEYLSRQRAIIEKVCGNQIDLVDTLVNELTDMKIQLDQEKEFQRADSYRANIDRIDRSVRIRRPTRESFIGKIKSLWSWLKDAALSLMKTFNLFQKGNDKLLTVLEDLYFQLEGFRESKSRRIRKENYNRHLIRYSSLYNG